MRALKRAAHDEVVAGGKPRNSLCSGPSCSRFARIRHVDCRYSACSSQTPSRLHPWGRLQFRLFQHSRPFGRGPSQGARRASAAGQPSGPWRKPAAARQLPNRCHDADGAVIHRPNQGQSPPGIGELCSYRPFDWRRDCFSSCQRSRRLAAPGNSSLRHRGCSVSPSQGLVFCVSHRTFSAERNYGVLVAWPKGEL